VETHAALSLLNALVRGGVRIRHDCGGKALCGTCRVHVIAGDAAALSPVRDRERIRLAAIGAGEDERLACQAYAARDVTVEVR
jgi:ferredoxin